ncbi:MAG: AsmA family protein, partial [Prevotellaceae bacterium]|nr:AsmA family protein [Prevotellaceae bacterium]
MHQIKSKGIKKTLKILGFTAAGFIILLMAAFILLQNNKIQNYITQSVVKNLSEALDAKIEVDNVYYQFFNTILVKKLYLEDLQKDTLLFVEKVNLRFSLPHLLKGQILIQSAELNAFQGNLVIDRTGGSNADFLLKALSNPDKTSSSGMAFDIKKLTLKNSSFSLTNPNAKQPAKAGSFDPGKFKFNDINTDISVNFHKQDSITFSIRKFGAKEEFSGFAIKDVKVEAVYSSTGILVPILQIQLPNSSINFDPVLIGYDSVADFKNFSEKIHIMIPVRQSTLRLSDLAAFAPDLKQAKGSAVLSADLSGRLSNLKLKNLKINYG